MPGELAAPFAVAVDHVSQLTVNGVPDASTQASTFGIRSLCHEATTFEDRQALGAIANESLSGSSRWMVSGCVS